MKRKITVKLGRKEFSLVTDETTEAIQKTIERIEREFKKYEPYLEEAGMEKILFVMLANAVLENVKMLETVEKLKKKLHDFVKSGGEIF